MYYLEVVFDIFDENMDIINFVVFSWQLSLTAGEEVDIEYEVDGWFYVSLGWDNYLYLVWSRDLDN